MAFPEYILQYQSATVSDSRTTKNTLSISLRNPQIYERNIKISNIVISNERTSIDAKEIIFMHELNFLVFKRDEIFNYLKPKILDRFLNQDTIVSDTKKRNEALIQFCSGTLLNIKNELIKNVLVALLHNVISSFLDYLRIESNFRGYVNGFGLGVLVYLQLKGKLYPLIFERYRDELMRVFAMDLTVSEPYEFFLRCRFLFLDEDIYRDHLESTFIMLPSRPGSYMLPTAGIVKLRDILLTIDVLWALPNSRGELVDAYFPRSFSLGLSRHMYHTFNYKHFHVHYSVESFLNYCMFNVYRTWCAQVKMSLGGNMFERRVSYVSVANDVLLNDMTDSELRYYVILKLFCAIPCPFGNIFEIPEDVPLFKEFIDNYIDMYQHLILRRWAINLNIMERNYYQNKVDWIFLNAEQERLMNTSEDDYIKIPNLDGYIRENIRRPILEYVVRDEQMANELASLNKTKIGGYATGPALNVENYLTTIPFLAHNVNVTSNTRHYSWHLLAEVNALGSVFLSPPTIQELNNAFLVNNRPTYALRNHGVDNFKMRISPIEMLNTVTKNDLRFLGDNIPAQLMLCYCLNEKANNIGNVVIGENINENWNGSTLKLASLLIMCFCKYIANNYTDFDVITISRFSYLVLGTITEPVISLISRFTDNKWSGKGEGRYAEYPFTATDFENNIVSNVYDMLISDMQQSYDSTMPINDRKDAVNAQVLSIINMYYEKVNNFLIIKVNYLNCDLITLISTFFQDDPAPPYITFVRSQFSKYGSLECYLIIVKVLITVTEKVTWTDLEKRNIVWASGVQPNGIPQLPFKLNNVAPHMISLRQLNTHNALEIECFEQLGNLIVVNDVKDLSAYTQAFFSARCANFIEGADKSVEHSIYYAGILEFKRAMLRTRAIYYPSLVANDKTRVIRGRYSLADIVGKSWELESTTIARSFTNGQRFAAFLQSGVIGLPSELEVIDVGGRNFEGIIFAYLGVKDGVLLRRDYTLYDRINVLTNVAIYDLNLFNRFLTDDEYFELIQTSIVIAYNSIFMIAGQTSNQLMVRLNRFIGLDHVPTTVISFYVYNPEITVVNYLEELVKIPTPESDGMTLGDYERCGYLTLDQRANLYNVLIGDGYTVIEVNTTSVELLYGCLLSGVSCDGHTQTFLSVLNTTQVCWVLRKG